MVNFHASRRGSAWSLTDSYGFISTFLSQSPGRRQCMRALHGRSYKSRAYSKVLCPCLNDYPWRGPYHPSTSPCIPSPTRSASQHRRNFHDYFVTHLPSSSLHPDSRSLGGPGHKLPRSASTPHTQRAGSSPAAVPPNIGANRELTVVRIPLKSAKHHFGASVSRGTRPYNEDTYQAGTIEIPAFAKRAPVSLSRKGGAAPKENTSAEGASGDPQVFYFGVFDGHGGDECSKFLKEDLHTYIEGAVGEFELGSSLKKNPREKGHDAGSAGLERAGVSDIKLSFKGKESLDAVSTKTGDDVKGSLEVPSRNQEGILEMPDAGEAVQGEEPQAAPANKPKAAELEMSLINQWKSTVGGYFRRFKPDYFDLPSNRGSEPGKNAKAAPSQSISIETVLMYAFLRADLDFITAQASKPDPDSSSSSDLPLNNDEILGRPSHVAPSHRIGGPTRFKGGSTASVALISTPTPTPFWHPASPSTLVVAHVGDTRILLCATSTGLAVPITTNHHPSSPVEGTRLRRYAATFVTDSFGEERMSGLANTRSFGDMRSKRIGVSAEPELVRVELGPAEYSFLVLVSDGVSGTLSDQEIVDVVKEAKTPEQGSRDVVSFATEVSKEGDNTTCLVVRLGGWERRGEGGTGSLGTKEIRDWRRGDAADPRSRRT